MRSLIKIQMSRYPVFSCRADQNNEKMQNESLYENLLQGDQTNQRNIRKKIVSKQKNNRQQIFSHSYADRQPSKPLSSRLGQKSIQKYISELTSSVENGQNEHDLGETKMKTLKRIIQNFDIKMLDKNQYSKLINTFGLRIQSVINSQRSKLSTPSNRINVMRALKQSSQRKRINVSQNRSRRSQLMAQFSKQLTNETLLNTSRQKFMSIKYNKKKIQLQINTDKLVQKPLKFKDDKGSCQAKVRKYREFLLALNMSNQVIQNLEVDKYEQPLKYYVGRGNNANLIKAIMKRRFWFEQTNNPMQANFIWTQIKITKIYEKQKKNIKQDIRISQEKLQEQLSKTTRTLSPIKKNRQKFFMQRDIEIYQKILTTDLAIKYTSMLESKPKSFTELVEKCKGTKLKSRQFGPQTQIVHNHLQENGLLGNKKALFYTLKQYCKLTKKNLFDIVPMTFHIKKGLLDPEFKNFITHFNDRKKHKLLNFWIMKPGQFSNQGRGITCSNKIEEIKKRVASCKQTKGIKKTIILQLYLTNPLLYNYRKFDIRTYMLITSRNGYIRAYWYQQGYLRTSSYIWTLSDLQDSEIHLTNDAIQKFSQDYGKFQPGNKLTYNQFQRFLDTLNPNGRNLDLRGNLIPEMKKIATQAIKASFMFLDPKKNQTNYQIFGLDFMVDENFKPWLIQVNTNPCLDMSSPVLQRLIPYMVENAFRIGLDTVFPPPTYHPSTHRYNIPQNALYYNKFQLIFDEIRDGPAILKLYSQSKLMEQIQDKQQDQQQYEQQGQVLDLENM